MAVLDTEFLTLLLAAFVISRIDPIVNLPKKVVSMNEFSIDSSWFDNLFTT